MSLRRFADGEPQGYYLGPLSTDDSIQHVRRKLHRQNYFLAGLLDSVDQQILVQDGEIEAEQGQNLPRKKMGSKAARKVAPSMSKKKRRRVDVSEDDDEEDSNDDPDDEPPKATKRPMEAKQQLLHVLSSEIVVNTKLHGEITAMHTSFENWNSLLPHATIRTVLSFLGVSSSWLDFFTTYLETPLTFLGHGTTE
jgi:hypothetical protein